MYIRRRCHHRCVVSVILVCSLRGLRDGCGRGDCISGGGIAAAAGMLLMRREYVLIPVVFWVLFFVLFSVSQRRSSQRGGGCPSHHFFCSLHAARGSPRHGFYQRERRDDVPASSLFLYTHPSGDHYIIIIILCRSVKNCESCTPARRISRRVRVEEHRGGRNVVPPLAWVNAVGYIELPTVLTVSSSM